MKMVDIFALIGMFSVIWLISGLIGAWRFLQGNAKEMDVEHGKPIDRVGGGEIILSLLIFYLISCLGGVFTLYVFERDGKHNCWYYKSKI